LEKKKHVRESIPLLLPLFLFPPGRMDEGRRKERE